jgi:hypothetical protein
MAPTIDIGRRQRAGSNPDSPPDKIRYDFKADWWRSLKRDLSEEIGFFTGDSELRNDTQSCNSINMVRIALM